MMIDRKSKSLLEVGDKFRFRGLRGSEMDKPDNGVDEVHIEVRQISLTGEVEVWAESVASGRTRSCKVAYDLALRLIDENIWQPLEDR